MLDLLLAARAESDDERCEALLLVAKTTAESSSLDHGNVWLVGVECQLSMLRQREKRHGEAEAHTQRAVELLDDATRHTLVILESHIHALPSLVTSMSSRVRDTVDLLADVQAHLLAANVASTRPVWWAEPTDAPRRALPQVLRQVRQCTALVDYVASNPKMLSFRAGESFAVLSRHSSRFYKARHKQRVGLVPCSAVRMLDESAASGGADASSSVTPRSTDEDWIDPDSSSGVGSGSEMSSTVSAPQDN